jgi:hypothetical protein
VSTCVCVYIAWGRAAASPMNAGGTSPANAILTAFLILFVPGFCTLEWGKESSRAEHLGTATMLCSGYGYGQGTDLMSFVVRPCEECVIGVLGIELESFRLVS